MRMIRGMRSEEGELERQTRKEALWLVSHTLVMNAAMRPGAYIQRWRHRMPHIENMRAEHFDHPIVMDQIRNS